MPQVMVTGAAGYIGSIVVQALMRSGYDILGIDDLSRGHRAAIDEGLTFYRIRAGDYDGLDRILQGSPVDAVVHLLPDTSAPPSPSPSPASTTPTTSATALRFSSA